MSTTTQLENSEADDELLTSYLDQELTPAERRDFERRLVNDERLRQRLAEMRRAWDLLDELPETPFTPNFTQSTLEMVAVDLEKEKTRAAAFFGLGMPAWLADLPKSVRITSLLVLAAVGGLLIGLIARHRYRVDEARTIAMAARLPILREFTDLEKLQSFTEIPGWRSLLEQEKIQDRILHALLSNDAQTTVSDYVSHLDAHHKELLWQEVRNFRSLAAEQRKDIETRYELAVTKDDTQADLRDVANALVAMLQLMPSNTRAEIQKLPEDRKIQRLKQEMCFQLARDYGPKLTAAEKEHVVRWRINEAAPKFRENLSIPEDLFNIDYILSTRTYATRLTEDEQRALVNSLCRGLSPETKKLVKGMSLMDQLAIAPTWGLDRRAERNQDFSADELYALYNELDSTRQNENDLKRPEDAREYLERRDMRRRRDNLSGRGPGGLMNGPPGERPLGPRPGFGGPPDGRPPNGSPPPRPDGFLPPRNGEGFPSPPPGEGYFPPRPGDRPSGPGSNGLPPRVDDRGTSEQNDRPRSQTEPSDVSSSPE
jgi:hypothetical protein